MSIMAISETFQEHTLTGYLNFVVGCHKRSPRDPTQNAPESPSQIWPGMMPCQQRGIQTVSGRCQHLKSGISNSVHFNQPNLWQKKLLRLECKAKSNTRNHEMTDSHACHVQSVIIARPHYLRFGQKITMMQAECSSAARQRHIQA